MKTFFKCTLSAMAVTAMVVLAFLSGGCKKDPEVPSGDGLLGTWSVEFEEEEFNGSCVVEYAFLENGEAIFTFISQVGEGTRPILWRAEGNKLYHVDKENKEFYDEYGIEWDYWIYKVSGNQLDFYLDGEVVASLNKKQ